VAVAASLRWGLDLHTLEALIVALLLGFILELALHDLSIVGLELVQVPMRELKELRVLNYPSLLLEALEGLEDPLVDLKTILQGY